MWKQRLTLGEEIGGLELIAIATVLALAPLTAKAVYLPPTGLLGAMVLYPALSALCASIVTRRHLLFGGFAGVATGLAGAWYAPKQSTALFDHTPFFVDVLLACLGVLVAWLTGLASAYPLHCAHKARAARAYDQRQEGVTCLYGCCLGPLLGGITIISLTFLTLALSGGMR